MENNPNTKTILRAVKKKVRKIMEMLKRVDTHKNMFRCYIRRKRLQKAKIGSLDLRFTNRTTSRSHKVP